MNSNSRDSFEVDDGLEGVDDFMNEPNPFDDDQAIIPDTDEPVGIFKKDSAVISTIAEANIFKEGNNMESPPPYADPIPSGNINNSENINDITTPSDINSNANNLGELSPSLLNYYAKFFLLTSDEFKTRVYQSISIKNPVTSDLEQVPTTENGTSDISISYKCDLYGPVWMTASVVMTKFVTSGFINVLMNDLIKGEKYSDLTDRNNQFLGLVHSIWLFYGYTFLISVLIFYFITKTTSITNTTNNNDASDHYLNTRTIKKISSPVEVISIYGYSNINWIPICIIMDILEIFRSKKAVLIAKCITITIGGIKSGFTLFKNINNSSTVDRMSYTLILLLSLHALFCISIMFLMW
ncbi:hypothetical protein TBLA_0C00130 [Henningerozyma blattae CBS 6284]|uniref:Protein YIP n=1 Tax=Henningerozyma blattae (strain ATCC 34711 / CBS 6284 / DSM 70876 / NBRC 10599 / NRRL Y-10934 / UCD 77-7) TaxID=1071380 RepID=I2H0D3_HENB6|nr:hypothetical protein TBLA_0C00130 [Tetrapisispora blattae CBS 6284]CCH59835.1 hypothetical protein TBLA_0C00130 [Tetrapisispora blattae CBS 6284]